MPAQLYHLHHQTYIEDLPYWLGLAEETGGPVLELGCGTGRVLRPLAEAGYSVTGLDRDPDMLAHPNLQNLPNTQLIQADMTDFDLGKQFPLIILPCNTFSTLTAPQRQNLTKCIKKHLSPGGIFAASMPNPNLLKNPPPEDDEIETSFLHPNTGHPIQVSSVWEQDKDKVIISWHYDHLLPDGKVERTTLSTIHYPTDPQILERELSQYNFNVTKYGDFQRTIFKKDHFSLILQAKVK